MILMKKFLAVVFILSLLTVPSYSEERGKFAPLSEEFLEWREADEKTGERPSPVDRPYLSKNSKRISRLKDGETVLPVSYDLRNYGRVSTGVENQGHYNTCWSFASLGACESSYLTQKFSFLGDAPDFSKLHQAWFSYKDPNPENSFVIVPLNSDRHQVLDQGGNIYMTLAYLTRISGAVNETALPYDMAVSTDLIS